MNLLRMFWDSLFIKIPNWQFIIVLLLLIWTVGKYEELKKAQKGDEKVV